MRIFVQEFYYSFFADYRICASDILYEEQKNIILRDTLEDFAARKCNFLMAN